MSIFKFDNIGSRIKNFARRFFIWSFVIEAIAAIFATIGGIITLLDAGEGGEVFLFLLILPVGLFVLAVLCYIPCMFLYGFGQLIENTEKGTEVKIVAPAGSSKRAWFCANCNTHNDAGATRCTKCGGVRVPTRG